MRKKINISISIILVFLICLLIISTNSQIKEKNTIECNNKGTIQVWSWNNELIKSNIIKEFNKKYPDIKVDLITIPNNNNAYTTKLNSTLKSGVGTPDVFLLESAAVKSICNKNYCENLSNKPYNAEKLAKNMFNYAVKLGRNDTDESIRALTWQITPGGFFYRRSLAKKYLGTDDPKTIQGMMTTMDDFLALGERIKQASNGYTKLISSYSDFETIYRGSREKGWVIDGKLNIDLSMNDEIDYVIKAKESDYVLGTQQWTSSWTDSMSSDKVFGFMLASWGISNELMNNAPETSGDWAFVKAPIPFYWGGTWVGMYKNSTNKDLSWKFIEFLTSNKKFLKEYAINSADCVNNINVEKQLSKSKEGKYDFLNGQNIYEEYTKLIEHINGDNISEYDEKLNDLWSASIELCINGKIEKDQVIPVFKEKVKENYPELIQE